MKIFSILASLAVITFAQDEDTTTTTTGTEEELMTCETHADCPEMTEGCLWGNCTQYCDWGNNCFPACQCELWEDAIDDICPPVENCQSFETCETHDDCPDADEMCLYDDCSQYCDGEGRCFPACECEHWEDSIDGECPDTTSCEVNYRGCESHEECEMGEYCDGENRCWHLCDCFEYGDPVDGECPNEFGVESFCVSLARERDDEYPDDTTEIMF